VRLPRPPRGTLNVVLFALTVVSVLLAGGDAAGSEATWGGILSDARVLGHHLWLGAPFAATLLGILLAHEFAHYFAARHYRVDASLPYFIPFPSLLGTLGAVIRMRGDIPHRRALVAIGASGPVAGFLVALPALVFGLRLSQVRPAPPSSLLPAQSLVAMALRWAHGQPVLGGPLDGVLLEGPSLAYLAVRRLVLGPMPPGHDVYLHPVALAAWFGFFITALNLIPVGQLDGGHVLYAVAGPRARRLGLAVCGALAVLGLVAWPGWLLWALLAWKVIRPTHPPVLDPGEPLRGPWAALAWGSLVLLALVFVPVPMQEI
jgi:membrane-associated protease RseP (regulator of RpoE activity)